eukprot:m.314593 g.314593  ORF g.314593 m.314593 type:complete len:158 (+) comp23063_c0_seq12:3882-4355(+)
MSESGSTIAAGLAAGGTFIALLAWLMKFWLAKRHAAAGRVASLDDPAVLWLDERTLTVDIEASAAHPAVHLRSGITAPPTTPTPAPAQAASSLPEPAPAPTPEARPALVQAEPFTDRDIALVRRAFSVWRREKIQQRTEAFERLAAAAAPKNEEATA